MWWIMANKETWISEIFKVIKAKSNTKFCNACNKFIDENNFEKKIKTQSHLITIAEKLIRDVRDLNVNKYTHAVQLGA